MIKYLKGDATEPIGEGVKLIVHICNNKNRWGAGFVLALSKKWKDPEEKYRMYKNKLGEIKLVQVEKDIIVVNMIAQEGTGPNNQGNPPIRYNALKTCLEKVNKVAVNVNATVHMPRIGAGLAGGDWNVIEQIIKERLTVDTFVYDLK